MASNQIENNFDSLESNIFSMLTIGDYVVFKYIREQYKTSLVSERKMTPRGFLTRFAVPQDAPRLKGVKTSFSFCDIIATHPELNYGAGFLLNVSDSVIHSLDGYTYGEKWPVDLSKFELQFMNMSRDYVKLQSIWNLS